jgi:hypothetical protein
MWGVALTIMEEMCNTVAGCLKNRRILRPIYKAGRPFRLYFRQTSPARLNSQSVMPGCIHPKSIRGRNKDGHHRFPIEIMHIYQNPSMIEYRKKEIFFSDVQI